MRSPIFSATFCPSEARTCGLLTTLVRLSVIIRFRIAPGSEVDQLFSAKCPSWDSVVAPDEVVDGVVTPLASRAAL